MFKYFFIVGLFLLPIFAVDYIAKQIFLGEVFASGNAYFISFGDKSVWPKSLKFQSFDINSEAILAQKIEVIPLCSAESFFLKKEKKLAGVDYIKGALFSTILDECVQEVVGKYRFKPKILKAYNVIASSSEVIIKNISFKYKGSLRSVQENEKADLKRAKEHLKQTDAEYECTTEARFLDEAKVLLEFEISESDFQGRLSHYFDPGCAGHLSNIYILDIMKNGKFVKSFKTLHYEGAI